MPSASRRFLRTEPRWKPDAGHIRRYSTNWGEDRYSVEPRQGSRVLSDKDFPTHADALAFAKVEARWHCLKVVDRTRG